MSHPFWIYKHIFFKRLIFFNPFRRKSVQFTIVVMTWKNLTSYSIVFTYVNLRSGTSTLVCMFRCTLFTLLFEQHKRVIYFYVILLGTQLPRPFSIGIWNLSLVTNLQYVHCAHIDFNTVHFWYGIILNKCTLCALTTSAKTSICLIINAYGYF